MGAERLVLDTVGRHWDSSLSQQQLMLPLGLLVVFTCPDWTEGHLQHQFSISGYFLEGFSGDDWVMKASAASMQSLPTKGFKIGTDYCGRLDPVEVSPGEEG